MEAIDWKDPLKGLGPKTELITSTWSEFPSMYSRYEEPFALVTKSVVMKIDSFSVTSDFFAVSFVLSLTGGAANLIGLASDGPNILLRS